MKTTSRAPVRNLKDFVSLSTDWFWETDAQNRFINLSADVETTFPVDSDDILGKQRVDLTIEDTTSDKWQRHLSDINAHRAFFDFDYEVKLQGMSRKAWVRSSGVPISAADGTFQGYRGVAREVTAEKTAIARLEATNEALAQRNKQLDEARCALERSLMEDILTSAWNRRAFERDLQDLFRTSRRCIGLMHIDLDRFKWVNDTCGHPAGDVVLQTAATRIRLATGSLGTVYRVGGDEFTVLLCEHVTTEIALALGHRITDAMTASVQIGQRSITIGASVGIAFAKTKLAHYQSLASQADIALYRAKQKGRNSVCIVDESIQNLIADTRQISGDIPLAIDRQEFVPRFQPQMNVATGEVIGAEVLVRWHHPKRGILSPIQFMKAAIEHAVIEDIDRLMLQQGMAAVRRIKAAGFTLPCLSINTSEARIMDPRLLADIGCHWHDPDCALSFELLETIYFDELGHNEAFHKNLRRLRDMGVRIETDDFGTGRASITGLLQIAPDRLKIDKKLVNEIVTSSRKRSMVKAILEMSNALGIECIAEGVETADTVDAIRALGCEQVQGFAVSPPLTEAELLQFLKNHSSTSGKLETKTAGPAGIAQSA